MKLLFDKKKSQQGQVLVEYLLLMVIAVGMVTIITKAMINRSDDNMGFIIKSWNGILKNIANDLPDCGNQKDMSTANCPQN